MKLKSWHLAVILILVLFLAACSQSAGPAANTKPAIEEQTASAEVPAPEPIIQATNTTIPKEAAEELAAESESVGVKEPTEESAPQETAEPVTKPIEVTYTTPGQQEGPYYTVDKPEDRDNDLTKFLGASGMPQGQILEFGGKVYDVNGFPLEGVTIEIWQTDANGVYLHPDDPDTASRDPNFQFYGEAITDAVGSYGFRTILPGEYEPRPAHIHFKVKMQGQELLTSQFYFSEVADLQGAEAALLITTEPGQDSAGNPILKAERDIILNQTIN